MDFPAIKKSAENQILQGEDPLPDLVRRTVLLTAVLVFSV